MQSQKLEAASAALQAERSERACLAERLTVVGRERDAVRHELDALRAELAAHISRHDVELQVRLFCVSLTLLMPLIIRHLTCASKAKRAAPVIGMELSCMPARAPLRLDSIARAGRLLTDLRRSAFGAAPCRS